MVSFSSWIWFLLIPWLWILLTCHGVLACSLTQLVRVREKEKEREIWIWSWKPKVRERDLVGESEFSFYFSHSLLISIKCVIIQVYFKSSIKAIKIDQTTLKVIKIRCNVEYNLNPLRIGLMTMAHENLKKLCQIRGEKWREKFLRSLKTQKCM